MKLLVALAVVALTATGCATSQNTLVSSAAPSPSATVPPDLSGHQYDRPDADHVLVAGDGLVLTLPTGTVRLTVGGPALKPVPSLVTVPANAPYAAENLPRFLATFTVTATTLTGTATLGPKDFRLLAIADQVDGGARVTTTQTATTLVQRVVDKGRTVVGTWSAPFVEGHGELLYTAPGAPRPSALWDFRAEA